MTTNCRTLDELVELEFRTSVSQLLDWCVKRAETRDIFLSQRWWSS